MTWRTNAKCLNALVDRGFVTVDEDEDPSEGTLQTKLCADKLVTLFKRDPALTADITEFNRDDVPTDKGLVPNDLIVHMIGQDWLDETALSDAEEKQLTKSHPGEPGYDDLLERRDAVRSMSNLFWSSLSRDSHEGEVQKRLITEGLLLIEVKRSGKGKPNLKLATDDEALILEWFVEPRGDRIVTLSTKIGGDCRAVAKHFPAVVGAMKAKLGGHLTNSLTQLLPVAEPDVHLLFGTAAIAAAPKK